MSLCRGRFIVSVGGAAAATSLFARLGTTAKAQFASRTSLRSYGVLNDTQELGRIDGDVLSAAIRYCDSMPINHKIAVGARWKFVGPLGVVKSDALNGTFDADQWPTTGRINAVAYDPSTPGTWYAGSGNGGFWKGSTNGPGKAASWHCLSETWRFPGVSSIAVDKTGENIYVGTGDCSWQGNFALGVMRSQTGGSTWENVSDPGFYGYRISRVVLNPDNEESVLAAEFEPGGGIWLSLDGGSTWKNKQSTSAQWLCIEFGLLSKGKRYCWALDSAGNIWCSDDGGSNWTALKSPVQTGCSVNRPQIICSPTTPGVLYLYSPAQAKVWSHDNYGFGDRTTWRDITFNYQNVTTCNAQALSTTYCMACAPITLGENVKRDVLFVGALNLLFIVLADAYSNTWYELEGCNGKVDPTFAEGCTGHADLHALAVSPFGDGEILLGNDGGVYTVSGYGSLGPPPHKPPVVSRNSSELNVQQLYSAEICALPSGGLSITAAMQDTGTALSAAGNWPHVVGGDGGSIAINRNNCAEQFATEDFYASLPSIHYTANNWKTSSSILDKNSPILGDNRSTATPIALDPFTNNDLYVATAYLYKYTISSRLWTNRLGGQLLGAADEKDHITTIALTSTNGNVSANLIYVGSRFGLVWKGTVTNSGTDWRQITGKLPSSSFYITAIAFHPANPLEILLTVFGRTATRNKETGALWRCADTSASTPTWTNVSGDYANNHLPFEFAMRTVVHDPYSPDTTWYVAGDLGVYMTTDAGSTWSNAGSQLGLPNVRVSQLKLGPAAQGLYAITYGRGIYSIDLSPP